MPAMVHHEYIHCLKELNNNNNKKMTTTTTRIACRNIIWNFAKNPSVAFIDVPNISTGCSTVRCLLLHFGNKCSTFSFFVFQFRWKYHANGVVSVQICFLFPPQCDGP